MIVNSVCNSCFETYRITIMPSDIELIKQISTDGRLTKCPRFCGGSINIIGDPTIYELHRKFGSHIDLTGIQLYKALMGGGLPDEIPKDLLTIDSILKSYKVVATSIECVDGRFYLHEITLDNGAIIHLAGGSRGAQVLKITRQRETGHGVQSII